MPARRIDRGNGSRTETRGGWGWGSRRENGADNPRARPAIPAAQFEAVMLRVQQLSGTPVLTFDSENGDNFSTQGVPALVRGLLQGAIRSGASHLHLVPGPNSTRARIRVGGTLRDWTQLPASLHEDLLAELRGLADGSEAAQPNGFRAQEADREWALHLSQTPGLHGETVVCRILPWETARFSRGLNRLGISPDDMVLLERITGRMSGLLLVGGPARAGTTTTLYSLVHRLNTTEHHVVTVEDPVEAPLPGATQIAVRPDGGPSFAEAVAAALREDPDVLMVSGLPDAETIQRVLRAARGGVLVLAAFAADRATAVPTDLAELCASRHWVGGAFAGALAQRPIRRLCEACKRPAAPSEALLRRLLSAGEPLEPLLPRDTQFHTAGGCTQCRNTGYQGRTSLYEVLEGTPAIRAAIARGASSEELEELAKGPGSQAPLGGPRLRTLATDGIRKAAAGDTSLEEVAQVLGL